MTHCLTDLSRGVFDAPTAKGLSEAYEKAERYLDRLFPRVWAEIDRDKVARRIVSEARAGETQPDLVWRAAVAKVLLETRAQPSKIDSKPVTKFEQRHESGRPGQSVGISPAGPHAAPHHTNEDATPGSGALPCELPGDDVDPGTG